MSDVQSSLLSFPGPGARGSRSVALWVTEMESCQGYHDGPVRYGWLAASCLNNAAEQRMLVGVVPVDPGPCSCLDCKSSCINEPSCCSGSCGGFLLVPFGCPVCSTDRTSSARAGSGRTEKAGRWTEHGTNVAKWEAGKANGPWRDAGPTQRTAGWTTLNRPGLGWQGSPGGPSLPRCARRAAWLHLALPSLEFVSVAGA